MKTRTLATNDTQVNLGYETARFALGTGATLAALIGLWACACLISALFTTGVSGTVMGFITAITGA